MDVVIGLYAAPAAAEAEDSSSELPPCKLVDEEDDDDDNEEGMNDGRDDDCLEVNSDCLREGRSEKTG